MDLPTHHREDFSWPPARTLTWPWTGGEADDLHPGAVGVEVTEREPLEPGVLQPLYVVLDVNVVTHVRVELDRVAGVVGVVTPVAVAQRREQRSLRALVEVFATND